MSNLSWQHLWSPLWWKTTSHASFEVISYSILCYYTSYAYMYYIRTYSIVFVCNFYLLNFFRMQYVDSIHDFDVDQNTMSYPYKVICTETLVTKTPYFLDYFMMLMNPIFGIYNPFYPFLTQFRVLFFQWHTRWHTSTPVELWLIRNVWIFYTYSCIMVTTI